METRPLNERITEVLSLSAEIAVRQPEAIGKLRTTYRDVFGEEIQVSCGDCMQKAYLRLRKYVYLQGGTIPEPTQTINQLITKTNEMKDLKDRKFLLMEDRTLQTEFGGDILTNDNMTDKQAAALLTKFPALQKHFARIPEDFDFKVTEDKESSGEKQPIALIDMKKPELQDIYEQLYGEAPKARLKSDELIAAIEAKRSENESGKLIDHVVTEDDLKENPELVEAGVKVGDVVQISPDEDAE